MLLTTTPSLPNFFLGFLAVILLSFFWCSLRFFTKVLVNFNLILNVPDRPAHIFLLHVNSS